MPHVLLIKKNPMLALELKNLEKTYANGVQALCGINLSVKVGDFFALLGVNGAGKSTTIGLISTLLTKTSGNIFIYGHSIDEEPELIKSYLGIVPQELNLNIFETCEEILLNQAGYYGIWRKQARGIVDHLLEQLGLMDKKNSIARHLSGGMKRRLMIARALVHQPKILILDEPTAGVDIEIRRSMWAFFKRINCEGTTIILTTHYLEEAEHLCKNIAIINQGQIIENTSMKSLLQTLRHQTLIFSLEYPLTELPDLVPLDVQLVDFHTLELRIDDNYSLNDVFAIFSEKGLKIKSMHNKTNRLEELFLELIGHEQQ